MILTAICANCRTVFVTSDDDGKTWTHQPTEVTECRCGGGVATSFMPDLDTSDERDHLWTLLRGRGAHGLGR